MLLNFCMFQNIDNLHCLHLHYIFSGGKEVECMKLSPFCIMNIYCIPRGGEPPLKSFPAEICTLRGFQSILRFMFPTSPPHCSSKLCPAQNSSAPLQPQVFRVPNVSGNLLAPAEACCKPSKTWPVDHCILPPPP